MRIATFLTVLTVTCALIGCAGGGGTEPAEGQEPAPTADAPELPKIEADAEGRIGPAEMPDRDADPTQFLYWRVDQMFASSDTDGDGKLSAEEYTGEPFNFERIDVNTDGFITKEETVNDMIPVLREQGQIQ